MRRISGLLMAWLVVLTVIAGSVTSVTSAGASPSRPLDLAHGWGGAKACLLPPSGPVECFATESALRARSAGLRAHKASSGCPVSLYSGAGYTGNVLEVWPQGYWLNLSDFGFDKVTVSFTGTIDGQPFDLISHLRGLPVDTVPHEIDLCPLPDEASLWVSVAQRALRNAPEYLGHQRQ